MSRAWEYGPCQVMRVTPNRACRSDRRESSCSAPPTAAGQRSAERLGGVVHLVLQLFHRRGDRLGRRRWRGAALVGDHIAQRVVGLVPDARHDGDGACRDRPGKPLVVEGHEVLAGAAAPDEQDDVGCRDRAACRSEPLFEVTRCVFALDRDAKDHELPKGIAPSERADDVVDCLAARRGDDGDALRQRGRPALAGGVHEALCLELARDLCHLEAEITLARQGEPVDRELHAPLGGIA